MALNLFHIKDDMAQKPKEVKIGNAYIVAEATDDGKNIIIRIKLTEALKSFQQLSHILTVFLAKGTFKHVDKDKDTPIQ